MRVRVLLAGMVALAAVTCDSSVIPEEGAGLYRLESVNGYRVPFMLPIELGFGSIDRGDLLLLPDGVFELAIAGYSPVRLEGTAQLDGSTLTLAPADSTASAWSGTIGGDSIRLHLGTGPLYGTFRQTSRRPPAVADGTYVLASVNNAPVPAILRDGMSGTTRIVRRVLYDTLELRHGLFHLHSRRETLTFYNNGTDSALAGDTQRATFGTFFTPDGTLVLRDYWTSGNGVTMTSDTLVLAGEALTRTRTGPVAVESWQRIR